jgi:hypothetical protein
VFELTLLLLRAITMACRGHHDVVLENPALRHQPNGTFMSGRATRNMDRLQIRRVGDALFVDLSHIIKSDTDPAGWAAATIAV